MTESPEEITPPEPKPVRKRPPKKKEGGDKAKGVGVPFVLMCSGIATILGMTGGAWIGSTFSPQKTAVSVEVAADIQTEMTALQSSLDTLKKRTSTLETKQKEILNRKPAETGMVETPGTGDLAEFGEDLMPLFKDIETRLAALEKQAPMSASTPGTALETPEAMPVETTEEKDEKPTKVVDNEAADNNAFDDELAELRTSIATLETRLSNQSKRFVTVTQLKSIRERVSAMEKDFEKPPVLIPPFPREAVMDAITGKSEKSGSWMSGLLGDEVRVVDAEVVSRLDRIETFVEAGNIDAITKEVSYLPGEAKPVIENWLLQFDQGE